MRRHTCCALVSGVQTGALPVYGGSYATAVAWSSRRLLRSTKAWVNSGSTRDCDPTALHHDSAASAHSAATTSAQIPQVRMCIHPLAMADGLSAVPDYLPGRHRGERPRSWSSSPLLIVIPALDRHPRHTTEPPALLHTASRHRAPPFPWMTATSRNSPG